MTLQDALPFAAHWLTKCKSPGQAFVNAMARDFPNPREAPVITAKALDAASAIAMLGLNCCTL